MEDTEDLPEAQPDVEPIMQFFAYKHLPLFLQPTSARFHTMAEYMIEHCPRNEERSAGLRKLLEAKDCAVRAMLFQC